MYCAMIGDLIDSKKIKDDERKMVQVRLHQLLDEMNIRFSEYLASPFLITLGDEFQGLLTAAEPALEIIEYIDRGLARHQVRMRYGIGLGEISTGPVNRAQALGDDGPAYHYAREGVDLMREMGWTGFPVSIQTKRHDAPLLETICRLLNDLTEDWSAVQRQYVLDMEVLGEQLLTAEKNGVSQSNISRALKRGHYQTYQYAKETLKQYLLSTYDCPDSAGRLGRYNQAATLERNHKCGVAVPILEELLKEIGAENTQLPSRGDVLFLLSKCQIGEENICAAIKSAEDAIHWETNHGGPNRRLAELYQQLGICYIEMAEQNEKKGLEDEKRVWGERAIPALDQARCLCQNTPVLEAEIFNNLAVAYGAAGDLHEEINTRLKLMAWIDEKSIQTQMVCANLHNLGSAYVRSQEYEQAFKVAKKAVQMAEQITAPDKGIGRVYSLYAMLLFQTEATPEEVLLYAQKAVAYSKRDNDYHCILQACRLLEEIYRIMNRVEAADWAAEQCLRAERTLRKRGEVVK